MSNQPTPRGLPFGFKLFGLPLVFLGGLVAAFWPVSRFTDVFSAAFEKPAEQVATITA